MKNIFDSAKFGDKFRTRDGRMALYLQKSRYKDDLFPYCVQIEDMGMGISYWVQDDGSVSLSHAERPFDIIGKWEDPINEKELDRLAEEFADEAIRKADLFSELKLAFKEGYRKAKRGMTLREGC